MFGLAGRPLVLGAWVGAAIAVAVPASGRAAGGLPEQGVYDQCVPAEWADHCASRLRRIARAGFKVVQNMRALDRSDVPDIRAFADAAQVNGLKVIWSLNSASGRRSVLGSRLATRCGCSTEDAALGYLIGVLRSLPSTWGYYISDEPKPEEYDEVAAFARLVKSLDPIHERLIMGCGLCGGGAASVAPSSIDATLGTDSYPVREQPADLPVVAARVGHDAEGLQRVADQAGRRTVMALQAWRWGDSYYDSKATGIGPASRFPTRREIEMQRNAAIERGRPELILWYTLTQVIGWEPGQRPWWWEAPGDPAQRWANLGGGAFAPPPISRNRRPAVRFGFRVRPARRALRLWLDATRSRDPDGRIVRYRWSLRSEGHRSRNCSRRRCSMTLRRPGRRRVRLTVTDNRGASASRTRSIRIARPGVRR